MRCLLYFFLILNLYEKRVIFCVGAYAILESNAIFSIYGSTTELLLTNVTASAHTMASVL